MFLSLSGKGLGLITLFSFFLSFFRYTVFICLGHGCLPACLSVSCAHVGAGEGVGFPLEQELHTVFSYCVDAGT